MQKKFRLQAQNFFLTYPKCNLTPEQGLKILSEKINSRNRNICEYIIATEKHKDGENHLHAYLKLNKKFETESASFFDLGSNHGNYQGARSNTAVKRYCTKDGNFIADPPFIPKEKTWQAAANLAENGHIDLAIQKLRDDERSCRDLILHKDAIVKNLTSLGPIQNLPHAVNLESFGPLFDWERDKQTLILFGESGTGKTWLAQSLLPQALFFRHLDRLGDLKAEHEGFIFDEASIRHFHNEAQIGIVDVFDDTDIHIRYKTAHIPRGTPRIFTSNRHPRDILNFELPAVRRRILCIHWLGRQCTPNFEIVL